MAEYSAYASLSGFLKEKIIPNISYVIPLEDKIARMFPLKDKSGVGKQIVVPVVVSEAQGLTFGGEDSTGYAINTSVSVETVQAIVKTDSFVMEGLIAQDMIDRMQKDSQTVKTEFAVMTKSLTDQAAFAREISLLHGTAGVGNILARTNDSHTTQTFSISARTWSPALISRLVKGKVDIYNGASKVTATTSPVLSAFSIANHTITLVGTEADLDNVAAGYTLYPEGGYGKMMQGLSYVCGSTALTIHGLLQSTYPTWQSQTVSAGASKLNYDLVGDAVVALRNRGAFGNLTLIVDPIGGKNLKTELVKLSTSKTSSARFDNKTSILGFDAQDIEIVEHIFAKPGEALLFDVETIQREGVDVNFIDLGGGTKNYVMAKPGYNAAFYRVGFNQALVHREPSKTLKISDIGSATA
jgi:hypothetical protein